MTDLKEDETKDATGELSDESSENEEVNESRDKDPFAALVEAAETRASMPEQKDKSSSKEATSRKRPRSTSETDNPVEDKNAYSTGRWTQEEDELLKLAVDEIGARNWKRVAQEYLNDTRTDVQCLHRWQKVLRPGLVKGPWTKEEDDTIVRCRENNITKWSEIARHVKGRIGKQCRERWFNHLDPAIRKGEWTEEEDRKLIEGQALLGNRWSQIAKLFLPGRPENAVKNRWNAATRRRRVSKKSEETIKTDDKPKKTRAPRTSLTKTQARFKALKPTQDIQALGDAMEGMVSLALAISGASPKNKKKSSHKKETKDVEKKRTISTDSVAAENGEKEEEKDAENEIKKQKRESNSFSASRPDVSVPAKLKTEEAVKTIPLATPTSPKYHKPEINLSPSQPATKRRGSIVGNDSNTSVAALQLLSRDLSEDGDSKEQKHVDKKLPDSENDVVSVVAS